MKTSSRYSDNVFRFLRSHANVAVALCVLFVGGCERENPSHGLRQGVKRTLASDAKRTLLDGAPNDLARSALTNCTATPLPRSEANISTEASGQRINRTYLTLGFVEGATVFEVNTMLASVGGAITAMVAGADILEVRISDPGDLASYRSIITQLRADPIVRFVLEGAEVDISL